MSDSVCYHISKEVSSKDMRTRVIRLHKGFVCDKDVGFETLSHKLNSNWDPRRQDRDNKAISAMEPYDSQP